MADTATTPAPESGDGTTSNAGSGTTHSVTIGGSASTDATIGGDPPEKGPEWDPDRAKKTIDTLRAAEKEGKTAARERDELKARLDEIEAAKLTDQERTERERDEATKRAEGLETRLRDEALKVAVLSEATSLGIASPRLALAALDRSAIEYDEDGAPQGVKDALEALLEAEPVLRGTAAKPAPTGTSADAGAGQKTGPKPDLTSEELAMAERLGMTPERYAALRDVETVDDYRALQERDKAAAGG